MTDNKLKEIFAELAVAQARTELQFEKTEAQFEKTEAQFERIEAQMRKTDEKLKSMGIHVGGMANSHGYGTEEYFFNSLEEDKRLGNLKFDEISRNLHYKIPNLEDEFDITMFNGKNVAIIECKYNAKEEDVVKLIEKKSKQLQTSFSFLCNPQLLFGYCKFFF